MPPGIASTRLASPPASGISYSAVVVSSPRLARNVIAAPSGRQATPETFTAPVTNGLGAPPLASMTCSSAHGEPFSSSSGSRGTATTNATVAPSGEISAADTARIVATCFSVSPLAGPDGSTARPAPASRKVTANAARNLIIRTMASSRDVRHAPRSAIESRRHSRRQRCRSSPPTTSGREWPSYVVFGGRPNQHLGAILAAWR